MRNAALFLITVSIMLIAPMRLSVRAMGAETDESAKALERREDLDFLYNTLKEVHPDLFAHTGEARFLAKKAEIAGKIHSAGDFAFSLELQSLVALVGDSHTALNLNLGGLHFHPFDIEYFDGEALLAMVHKDKPELLGQKVFAVNGFPLEEVYDRFREIISHDNEVKLRRQFTQMVFVAELLEYFGFSVSGRALTLSLRNAQGGEHELTLEPPVPVESAGAIMNEYLTLDKLRKERPPTEFNRERIYFAEPLDESAYYIQYNQCREDPNFPMPDFCVKVAEELEAAAYNKIIVDMRYNGGGGDGVLVPLLTLLSEKLRACDELKLFCLVDEMTFSSAINNTMMMKDMGAIVAGSPTGGSVDHFGSLDRFTLPNSGLAVAYSTKLIDAADFLESGHGYGIETLVPDYPVPQTLEDYLDGVDSAVRYVLERGDELALPARLDAPLTRGGFFLLLRQKALAHGKGGESGTTPFADVFPFVSTTPAVEWAYHAGLAGGAAGGRFAPAHIIGREEVSELLARFAAYLGEGPAPRADTLLAGRREPLRRRQAEELLDSLYP